MSVYIALIIMLVAGTCGGIVNALIRREYEDDEKNKVTLVSRAIIGIGASFLVPLFLEIANSNLMTDPHCSWDVGTGKIKGYFLYFSYCLLAAMAGPQFIKNLIKNVLKADELKALRKKVKLVKEKDGRKAEEDLKNAQREESDILHWFKLHPQTGVNHEKLERLVRTKIGKITPGDRQKGRFGDMQERNGRRISAKIKPEGSKGRYLVTVTVESTDPANNELTGYVLFYLHETFRPCARQEQVLDGEAVLPDLNSIGTYTVGAVADNGETFLEYDLSDCPDATEEFKSV